MKKEKTFTETEIVKAYQKVYKKAVRDIDNFSPEVPEKLRQMLINQTFITLASLQHELGLDK